MRKIISILVTLGVILGMTLMAVPVAAAAPVCPTDCTPVTIDDLLGPPDFCAGSASNYLLGDPAWATDITVPVTLTAGTDSLSVEFPAGTDLSSVVFTGVTVTDFVIGSALDKAADLTGNTAGSTRLEFVVPMAFWPSIPAGDIITIQVDGVVNSLTAGKACLYVNYKLACCDPVVFDCVQYTIAPAKSTVDFHFDFGLTYADIAEDFIPPFKACGQDGYGTLVGGVGWMTDFDLILRADVPGCNPPCASPTAFWFQVTKCPVGEVITLDIPGAVGTPFTLTSTAVTLGTKYDLMALWIGWPPPDVLFPASIHFSSPGDYELKFFLKCPASCGAGELIIDEALPATAYQYKDAWKCEFDEKWNLWSLPLYPFDTDIDSIFASMDRPDQLKSVWYFGQCEDSDPNEGVWHSAAYDPVAGTFTPGDMEIQAGKAYWVRMLHLGETGYDAAAFPVSLWVFGTHAIMPEPPGIDPGYFNVCEGWNMVGFKPEWDVTIDGIMDFPKAELDNSYLWNFNPVLGGVHYGLIYQWVPTPLPGNWATYTPGTLLMQPCEGYWIPFDGDLQIYPKA